MIGNPEIEISNVSLREIEASVTIMEESFMRISVEVLQSQQYAEKEKTTVGISKGGNSFILFQKNRPRRKNSAAA